MSDQNLRIHLVDSIKNIDDKGRVWFSIEIGDGEQLLTLWDSGGVGRFQLELTVEQLSRIRAHLAVLRPQSEMTVRLIRGPLDTRDWGPESRDAARRRADSLAQLHGVGVQEDGDTLTVDGTDYYSGQVGRFVEIVVAALSSEHGCPTTVFDPLRPHIREAYSTEGHISSADLVKLVQGNPEEDPECLELVEKFPMLDKIIMDVFTGELTDGN